MVEAQASVQLAFSCEDVDVKWLGQIWLCWCGEALPEFWIKESWQ